MGTNIGSTKTLSEVRCAKSRQVMLVRRAKGRTKGRVFHSAFTLVSDMTTAWELSISVSKSMGMIYLPVLAIDKYTS